ncbi:MAG TPA: DegT/DnrJ/EryC1/StrS family aminotransferase [Rhodospirillales bacterium]|nr:DegT/DnrJ/EryC1/StrS family aminotransferase [Rhodospirillales bacterium]
MSTQIPLSCADITDREVHAATDALCGEVHALGPWTIRFEKAVAKHADGTFGIATNSSQSAMHVTLEALGISKDDEVITPAFSFPSCAATILRLGAIPVFADCNPRTLNANAKDIASKVTDKTKAIIASHTFGNPAGIDQVARVAQEIEIPLIEDAGQAIGSTFRNRQVGSFGRVAVFAFHSTTQITCIEGGVIVTDDDSLAEQCKLRRNHGFINDPTMSTDDLHRVRTDELMLSLGHGYRLSEVHAAVGSIQMTRLKEIMERRHQVSQWYTSQLGGIVDIMCPTIEDGVDMSWDGYVIRLCDNFSKEDRDEIIRGLHRHEIGAADFFQSIPTLPLFATKGEGQSTCPVAASVSERTLALPFYTSMTRREVDIVCQTLELMLKRGTFSES